MKYTHYVEIDNYAVSGRLALIVSIPTRLHQHTVVDQPDEVEYLFLVDSSGKDVRLAGRIGIRTDDAFTNYADAAKYANDFNLMRQNAANAD